MLAEKEIMRQAKLRVQKEASKAKILAERCLKKRDNVTQLKKELSAAVRKQSETAATLERVTNR